MLNIKIPRYRYTAAVYPNLDPSAEGLVIPERYGTLTNLVPVCIDLLTGKWKLNRRKIHAITEIREAGAVLVGYTVDLSNAEFTIGITPILQQDTTYYFILESDYAIDGANYLQFAQRPIIGSFPPGAFICTEYFINGAGTWSPTSDYIQFRVYGKTALDGPEKLIVDKMPGGAGLNWLAYLRKDATNTRLGQSFKTKATGGPWYLSRIQVSAQEIGSPSGSRITIAKTLTAYTPTEVQLGIASYRMENYTGTANQAYFAQRGAATDLSVDIEGIEDGGGALTTNVSDVVQDIQTNILEGDADALNAADLTALKTARTETIALNLDTETDYESIINKLETGQLWKYVPLLDGTIGLKYAASGEPAGTPHYRDEHFKSFKMRRKWSAIYERVRVKYAQDGGGGDFLIQEAEALSARYLYRNQKMLEVETFLKDAAPALLLAQDYLGTSLTGTRKQYLCQPTVEVEFELVTGLGWELIPSMKVNLTRTRAMSASGTLAGVLFYVLDVQRNGQSGSVTITAILDTMTY
jgi:hypothetical protein